uniref:Uncharacterized protein n=1 Tax=Panagrolaimus sp. PS1159 TaxID=55785 RepID=A0AC35G9A9_9BILA
MLAGGYLLGSTGIRIHGPKIKDLLWISGDLPVRGRLQPTMLKERTQMVYKLVPDRMKNLVIINSNFGDFECIQAAADMGQNYADNVIVITPLLARLTFALNDLQRFRNPPEKEVILVVTVTYMFADFVILKRDANFDLYVAQHITRKPDECARIFPEIYNDFYPHSTIFLAQEEYNSLVEDLRSQYQPENSFVKPFRRWDFFLLWGGLYYAMNDEDYDARYRIPNFTSGIEAPVRFHKSNVERCVILPERSPVPCEIYGYNGPPQSIQLFYFHDFFLVHEKIVYDRRQASRNIIIATGSSNQIIGYVDERGVPYASPTASVETAQKEVIKHVNQRTTVEALSEDDVKPVANSPIKPVTETESASVKFILQDNICAIEVYKNGVSKRLGNSEGKDWTPLYLSMVNGTPEIGEKAKNDYENLPKYVIYDVLKIVGKPLNAIKIDPKWGFKLEENDGNILFQIETPNGPRLIPQEIVLSAFLKAMKLQAEPAINTPIKEIRVITNFILSKSQKALINTAALKNNLKILSFDVTNIE